MMIMKMLWRRCEQCENNSIQTVIYERFFVDVIEKKIYTKMEEEGKINHPFVKLNIF